MYLYYCWTQRKGKTLARKLICHKNFFGNRLRLHLSRTALRTGNEIYDKSNSTEKERRVRESMWERVNFVLYCVWGLWQN